MSANNTNVYCSFDSPPPKGPLSSIQSFHSYQVSSGRLTCIRQIGCDAVEYHYKYAGPLALLDGKKELKGERLPGTVHVYAEGAFYGEDTRTVELPLSETYFLMKHLDSELKSLLHPSIKFARFFDTDGIIGDLFSETTAICSKLGNGALRLAQANLDKMIFFMLRSRKISDTDYVVSKENPRNITSFSHETELFMRKNLDRDIKLPELAAHMKVSESMLSHKFKIETGISPTARLIELRIELAKALLIKGEKLKAIALISGFNDEFHLSRTFKTKTGMTPSSYRESSRKS